jgi:prophage maintenance system killer protein
LTIALGWNFLVEENGISLLSPCQDLQIAMMSLQTLTMFIKTLPWGRWLNQISKRKTANRSGLYRKAISALGSLFAMIHKELQSEQFLWPWDEFKNVVEALLTDIPYYDEKLLIAAVQIWQELAEMVFDSHIADTKRRMAANLLIASAGGYTTPWGEFVGMCQAGKRWLSSSHDDGSIRFLERLFAAISSEDESVPSRKVLMAILRTFPGAAFQNWKSFQVVVERVSSMEPLTCLEIVEAFMLGRSYFRDAKIMGDEAITLSLQVLESARGKDTPQCIQSALVIYSCFLDDDWKLLEERGELDSHFRKIKMGCFSSSAKLREQACKSLGGFCSQFVGIGAPHRVELLYQRRLIAEDVCSTMLETYVDDNPAVRTMCIFALGNLANAIRESQSPNMLSTEAVYRLCLSMLHCFDDTNDKVVGNAIRCLGHAGFLLAVGASISTSTELLVPIIHVLASKIYSALAVVLNWEAKASLTWKQRSSAKKHGWGACHALRIIFQGISEDYLEAQTSLRKAISCAFKYLVLCQEYFNTLNQKVVGAAIMAISCLPVQLLETIGAETELVGVSLANAILMLLDKDVDLSSSQIETVLLQLLRSASISDAYYVVMNERIAASTFDALYSWMVKQGEEALNARAFEIFALALQRSRRWSNSVALEQKFASRAMRKNKQCSEFVDEPGTTSELVEDEEDEI